MDFTLLDQIHVYCLSLWCCRQTTGWSTGNTNRHTTVVSSGNTNRHTTSVSSGNTNRHITGVSSGNTNKQTTGVWPDKKLSKTSQYSPTVGQQWEDRLNQCQKKFNDIITFWNTPTNNSTSNVHHYQKFRMLAVAVNLKHAWNNLMMYHETIPQCVKTDNGLLNNN